MKKTVMFILVMLTVLTGCKFYTDKDYILAVKTIIFNDGVSVEGVVENRINLGEFYLENKDRINFENAVLPHLMTTEIETDKGKAEIKEELKELDIKIPITKKIDWKVEGKTKTGKVVVATDGVVTVKIVTIQDGDKITVNTDTIDTYENGTKKLIPLKVLETSYLWMQLVKESETK